MDTTVVGTTNMTDTGKLAEWFTERNIPVLAVKGKTGDIKKASTRIKIAGNYGVALGDGLIGVDYDEYHGANAFELFTRTRMWRSGSGRGYGILYRVSKELSGRTFSIGPGIMVRGKNAYLVGPGSIHPGRPEFNIEPGGIYTLVNDEEIQEAPEWLIHILEKYAESSQECNLELNEAVEPGEWLTKDKQWIKKFEGNGGADRSGQTYSLAAYSIERGATNEELAWIIGHFKPAIDKYEKFLAVEIPRIIRKLRDLHNHSGKPCDTAKCPNKPAWMDKAVVEFDFWTVRPEFKYIKQASESRMVAPKAVLMSVLCHIAASLPVEITLPAIIGERASLNFFVCFVGKSGTGKGASTGVAAKLYDYSKTGLKYKKTTPASGEGVVSTYISWDTEKKAEVQKVTNALLNFDEIDNLRATTDRQGSTLSAMLRQGFSGELIGYQLSKRNTELHPHSYRMALQLSAQPAKSDWLLEDGDGGLPQRFVFVTTTNPERPDIDDIPEYPIADEWRVPDEIIEIKTKKEKADTPNTLFGKLDESAPVDRRFIDVPICYKAIKAIQQARQDSLDEKEAELEGHALLVRLKVAALLGILNGRLEVNDEDWDLSAVIMVWSNQARNKIRSTVSEKNIKLQMARTTARAHQETVIDNTRRKNDLERVSKRIMTLAESGILKIKGANHIKMKIAARDREFIEEGIEYLVNEGKIKYDSQEDVVTVIK